MSYLKEHRWKLIPKDIPVLNKSCPKCSTKTNFINTGKFRVNANKSKVDIWMIYQCKICKSTWNLLLYDRINPKDITAEDYSKFQSNDIGMIRKYAFDQSLFKGNKAEVIWNGLNYEIFKEETGRVDDPQNVSSIIIESPYPIPLRIDKLLSDQFHLPRSYIKKMIQENLIYSPEGENLQKIKIKHGLRIFMQIDKNIGI